MRINPDETRWTAYVLDEVDLPERAELEAILACSSEARGTVTEIEDAIEILQDGMCENPQFRLTEKQLSAIIDAEKSSEHVPTSVSVGGKGPTYPFSSLQAVAAIVTITLILGALSLPGWLNDSQEQFLVSKSQGSETQGPPVRRNDLANEKESIAETNKQVGVESSNSQPSVVDSSDSRNGSDLNRGDAISHLTPFVSVAEQPLLNCTFQIGGIGYEAMRRDLWMGRLPDLARVDVGELISHFSYDYASPPEGQPLSVHMEATVCPWNARHRLVQIGLKGGVAPDGSRLPLKVIMLLDGVEVRERGFDRAVLLQVIASLRQRLDSDSALAVIDGSRIDRGMIQIDDGEQSVSIIDALTTLPQGAAVDFGVTNQWVLEKILAELNPSNRNEIVLVAGGANGARNSERIRLLALVEQAVPGVASYSLLGIGVADNPWLDQALAANPIKLSLGSVNNVAQANHFWESILKRAAEPVARDLKMQLEFNADAVAAYRQVGLATVKRTEVSERLTQFQEHDLKAGEEVTSLFEVIPRKEGELRASQLAVASTSPAETRERNQIRTQNMLTVKLNYRLVSDNQSVREVYPFADRGGRLREASENLKFTAAVAAHGMVLSDAPFRGTLNHYGILELAQDGLGEDLDGTRNEFLELVKRTIRILLNRSGRVSG